MNGSDSFLLDELNLVRVWSSRGANEYKEKRAKALGKHIIENSLRRTCTSTNLLISIGQYFLFTYMWMILKK